MRKSLLFLFSILVIITLIPDVSMGQKAKPEGKVVIADSTIGREIWTPLDGTMPEQYPMGMWNEKLVYRGVGGDQKLYGGLAESWTVSPDGLNYTFQIRKGINFNEGWGPFTAEDALFSLKLVGREDSLNVNKHIIRDWVRSMEAVNPHLLKITLKEPHPDFIYQLSDFYPYLMMVSKKYFETVGEKKAAKHPVGTGPWIFKEHILGDHLTIEAVENHWRKTPEFKTVVVKIVPEQGTRIAMLRAGEADLIALSTPFIKEVEGAGYKVISNPGATYFTLMFGGLTLPNREGYDPTAPWAQPDAEKARKVRKALCLAVNKKEIIDYILKGRGSPVAVHNFAPGGLNTNPAWNPYPYDPAEAKKLLAEAGYPRGFEKPIKMFLYSMPGRPELPEVGEAVAQYWEKIGLRVDRQPIDWTTWRDMSYSRSKGIRWTAHVLGSTPYLEPVVWYNVAAQTTVRVHQMMESLELDKLTHSAATEIHPERRKQKQLDLGQYIYDNYFCSPIAMKDSLWGSSPRVEGWTLNNLNSYLHNLEYIQRKK